MLALDYRPSVVCERKCFTMIRATSPNGHHLHAPAELLAKLFISFLLHQIMHSIHNTHEYCHVKCTPALQK